jgi:tRNA wybutosine-synthesizing protein 3
MSPLPTNLPESFVARKAQILADLATPEAAYEDASPKGSLDVQILDLINTINELPGYVTTSSCAGRIAVFVEGKKKTDAATEGHIPQNKGELSLGQKGETRETLAATGGKGGGGKWLYVSHDPYIFESNQGLAATLGLVRKHDSDSASWQGKRLVRFKFEPMV